LVACAVGWQGAVITLCNAAGAEVLVAASDEVARVAHELEVSLAEGPSREARLGLVQIGVGAELGGRWARLGPAVQRLGLYAVAAVPLPLCTDSLRGSLMVTGSEAPRPVPEGCRLADVAGILTRTLLRAPGRVDVVGEPELPGLGLFEEEDFQPTLHQAAGVLTARLGCGMDNAVALIRARAFARERPVAAVAADVLAGDSLEG